MGELTIYNLGLSNRSIHALENAGIINSDDIVKLSEADLYHIPNMGKKSVDEVLLLINLIKQGKAESILIEKKTVLNDDDYIVAWAHMVKDIDLNKVSLIDGDVMIDDLTLSEIEVGIRTYNALHQAGITTLSSLLHMTKAQLMTIKSLGKKSYDEILNVLKVHTVLDSSEEYRCNSPECAAYLIDLFYEDHYTPAKKSIEKNIYRILGAEENLEMLEEYEKNLDLDKRDLVPLIMQDSFFRGLLQRHVLDYVREKQRVSRKELRSLFPNEFMEFVTDTLQTLMINSKLALEDDMYELEHLSLKAYVDNMPENRSKEMLIQKLNGKTLEEIGKDHKVTRERVRQLIEHGLKTRPVLKEDKYLWLFEKYDLSEEMVQKFFGYSSAVYEYLLIACKKRGKADYLGILEEDVPLSVKVNVEAYQYRNYLDVNGEMVKKSRPDIVRYLLKTKCREEVTTKYFIELYQNFLQEYELTEQENLACNVHYIENHLSARSDVLWKHGKRLRFYEITDDDFEELLSELHFSELSDVEISTRYFINNYREVLDAYEIWDEYELHNLMKKRLDGKSGIDFRKMPHIGIGNFNRDMQVFDLLIENAPIWYTDFAKLYEEIYGVSTQTFLMNYTGCISEYLHGGIYSIDFKDLSTEESVVVQSLLGDPYYNLSIFKQRFKNTLPLADVSLINDYNLGKFGYKIATNLIFSTKTHKHFSSFLTDQFLSRDVIDMTVEEWLLQNPSIYGTIWEMKTTYDLIEFSPLKYIRIRKLEESGIRKKELEEFCEAAIEFAGERQFTIDSLKQRGFEHELFDLGFEDFFYVSILRYYKNLKCVSVGDRHVVLFSTGEKADIRALLEHIIVTEGSMDIYDLLDYLRIEYGIRMAKHKLLSWIKQTELYYSDTMEKVYLDYEQFFEEV